MQVPDSCKILFENAGWLEGRLVPVDTSVSTVHPAHEILRAFGGLHIQPAQRNGKECATNDIEFGHIPIRFSAVDVEDWIERLSVALVGVGTIHRWNGQIWLSDDGRYFSASCNAGGLDFVADNFMFAMETLLTGLNQKPLLPPNEEFVVWGGERVYRGDSRLYNWQSNKDPLSG